MNIIEDCYDAAYHWHMSPLEIAEVSITEMHFFSGQLNRIFDSKNKALKRLNRRRNP